MSDTLVSLEAADTIEQLTKERDCCLQHSEADDTEIEYLHAVAETVGAERDALREHLNQIVNRNIYSYLPNNGGVQVQVSFDDLEAIRDLIKPPVSAELRPSLCVGEYSIGTISENTIWIIKTDGEGGEFDADLFETFLNDFFSENF